MDRVTFFDEEAGHEAQQGNGGTGEIYLSSKCLALRLRLDPLIRKRQLPDPFACSSKDGVTQSLLCSFSIKVGARYQQKLAGACSRRAIQGAIVEQSRLRAWWQCARQFQFIEFGA